MVLIHDVNPSQLSGAFHCTDLVMSLREALLDARRDTVTHRATTKYAKVILVSRCDPHGRFTPLYRPDDTGGSYNV